MCKMCQHLCYLCQIDINSVCYDKIVTTKNKVGDCVDSIVNALIKYYESRNYIPSDKKEIYSYGFKLLLADIINFSLVIVLGVLIKQPTAAVVFLISLYCIRKYTGGFHAKTFFLCRMSMLFTAFSVMIISKIVFTQSDCIYYVVSFNIISVFIIILLAPIENPKKKLTINRKKKNKRKAIIVSIIMSIISYIFLEYYYGVVVSVTLLAVAILMIIGLIYGKGEQNVRVD